MEYKKVIKILLIFILIMTTVLVVLGAISKKDIIRERFNKYVDNMIFNANVNKKIQRTEYEVVEYVQTELNKKYPEITTIKLLKKQSLIHHFPAMGIGGERTIEGAYEYTFSIEDKYNNRATAIYKDGYTYRNERYDNNLIEYYHNIKDNFDKLETCSKFIDPYSKSLKIINKYYSAEVYFNEVRIVYVLDIKFSDLDITAYKDLKSYYDFLENYSKDNKQHNSYDYDIYDIDFSFKDKMMNYYEIRNRLNVLKANKSI